MTKTEFKNTIATINSIIANNNPPGAVMVIKQYYRHLVNPEPLQVEKVLNDLYNANELNYFSAIKQIQFNPSANNWTTSSETQQKINDLSSKLGKANSSNAKLSLTGGWTWIQNNLLPSSTVTPGTTPGSEPVVKPGTLILISVIGIVALISVYFISKKFA